MTPREQLLADLRATRELIAVPERWTQGQLARDKSGLGESPLAPTAARYCLDGAACVVARYGLYEKSPQLTRYSAISGALRATETDYSGYNDTHTHAEVLALVDATIARIEGEGEI